MNKTACLAILLMALFTGCTKDKAPLREDCQTCTVELSFSKDIIPILKNNCATAGCHDNDDASGDLVMDSAVAYSQLTRPGLGYVNPGSPKSSIMYTNVAPGSSDPMPQGYSLSTCEINRIYCWILQGGKNN